MFHLKTVIFFIGGKKIDTDADSSHDIAYVLNSRAQHILMIMNSDFRVEFTIPTQLPATSRLRLTLTVRDFLFCYKKRKRQIDRQTDRQTDKEGN